MQFNRHGRARPGHPGTLLERVTLGGRLKAGHDEIFYGAGAP